MAEATASVSAVADSAIRWPGREALTSCSSQIVPGRPRKELLGTINPAIAGKPGAAGNRNRETGVLAGIGAAGYYWSSSPRSAGEIYAANLDFNASNVNPLGWNNRSNAFSVRCVQASARPSLPARRRESRKNSFFYGPEWWRPRLLPARPGRFSNPLTMPRKHGQLYIPVCAGAALPDPFGTFKPAIAAHFSLRATATVRREP